MALLEVTGLNLFLGARSQRVQALRDLSFKVERGSALGIIGESGCGKSLTAQTLMGLQPHSAQVTGSILWEGRELLGQSQSQWQSMRGNRIAIVFQEPMTALNPVHTIGAQIAEPMRIHKGYDPKNARKVATALLERVGIANASARIHDYPHQFSGGQRQRITIAMALACEPDLLIADEPTTALDVTVQQQILDLINDIAAERNMALILISHDLGVISQNVDDMLVMYGGQIVESGPTQAIFEHMSHPYTRGLLASRPQLHPVRNANGQPVHLRTIAGTVPPLHALPAGCPFADRCHFSQPDCFALRPPRVSMSRLPPDQAPYSSLGAHQVHCLNAMAMGSSELAAHT